MSIVTALGLTEDALIGETSSSEYSSEGGTPTFDRIPFRVKAGRRPNLNTFVIALRQNDDSRAHYGRIITGSELNLRARPGGMQKDDAYGMPRTDIRSSELSPILLGLWKSNFSERSASKTITLWRSPSRPNFLIQDSRCMNCLLQSSRNF